MFPSNRNSEELNDTQERMHTLALILAGGSLTPLTSGMAKPALPFAGKYRVIDFVLCNLVNSDLNHIAALVQFHAQSLIEHLRNDILCGPDQQQIPEIQTWQASVARTGKESYLSTADAVYQNRNFIAKENCDTVMIVSGDHIYRQDYRELLRFHREKAADLTIAVMSVSPEDSQRFGMVEIDQDQRITRFVERPQKTDSKLASMGIYVFNTAFLLNCLEKDARDDTSRHDFGMDIIPPLVKTGKVFAYRHNAYWADLSTLDAYWKTNLDLLEDGQASNLLDPAWMLQDFWSSTVPANIRPGGVVKNSLVSEGCVIAGAVEHSVLSPGVRVEKGAIVRDSVILHDAVIHRGAIVNRCVVDNFAEIAAETKVGVNAGQTASHPQPGITFIGK